jgi:hypothetical protein
LKSSLIVALALLAFLSCRTVDLDADRAQLLRLHEEERAAHVGKNAALLTAQFSDEFVQLNRLNRGKIDRSDREAVRARLQAYFDRSNFLAWDDLEPPEIHVSSDGTMAWKIVHKEVRIAGDAGAESRTVFAWLATYEKRDGRWQLTSVASTNE